MILLKKCGIKEKSDTERKTKGLGGRMPDLSAHPFSTRDISFDPIYNTKNANKHFLFYYSTWNPLFIPFSIPNARIQSIKNKYPPS